MQAGHLGYKRHAEVCPTLLPRDNFMQAMLMKYISIALDIEYLFCMPRHDQLVIQHSLRMFRLLYDHFLTTIFEVQYLSAI